MARSLLKLDFYLNIQTGPIEKKKKKRNDGQGQEIHQQ